jgi:hypothetical protein
VTPFTSVLQGQAPVLTLAPMQEVTDGKFWTLVHAYGGADVYWTEYFRVQTESTPERRILDAITGNTTRRPVVAQLIGNDIAGLVRTAQVLQRCPVAAIDLNLGCPAPIVYRKCAGGGLLRESDRIDTILGALRDAVRIPFTVKTRIGFDVPEEFDRLLPIFARHSLDALTVHARTVAQLYRLPVHYERIRPLWASEADTAKPEQSQCDRMKKFVNYLGEGVPGPFLHAIRRARTAAEFHRIAEACLDHEQPMALMPAEVQNPLGRIQKLSRQVSPGEIVCSSL